jgi:phosphatidylglycerol:prolipoprotein diacylglycerol transferase
MPSNLPMIILSSPGAIAFHIGSWPVRWYGILISGAFFLSYLIIEKLIKDNDLNLDVFNDLILYVLISSIVCARLWFVFLSFDYFKFHTDEIPKIWLGGQSIHGGILGAILAALLFCKIKKISFYKYMDLLAAVFPLGQAIGRWGNFFNNEAFGKPFFNGFIKLYIPSESRPMNFLNNEYFHPTFLYESFFDFIIFVFLFKNYSNWKEKPGKIFWVYLLSYSIIRFFLEFLRSDSLHLFGLYASAQVISIIVILISLMNLMGAMYEKKI